MSSSKNQVQGGGLPEPDRSVAELVGRLMTFWGFRRNLGRIWSVLYLSPSALTASDLSERLGLSSGAVSMALNELQEWGVVKLRRLPGERREYFEAEDDLWQMISTVLARREWRELEDAAVKLEAAAEEIDPSFDPGMMLRRRRLQSLHQMLVAVQDGISLLLASENPDELLALAEPDELD